MTYRITLETNPDPEELAKLETGMVTNAMQKGMHEPALHFAFMIRDENNRVLGGVDGEIWFGCLHINHLWVDEPIRGSGYGEKLMLSAENFATEKGCTFTTANTMILEVVTFYKKLGYEVEFEREGYLKGSVMYYLRRDLALRGVV